MSKKLVILHLDGVSARTLERALDGGDMPHLRGLVEREDYEIHGYRCGLPSTTPFAQAGILYGDNSEIPSFRWWDRERRVLVQFGPGSTFAKVADRHFAGSEPLTKGGACIAACYPGEAADDFGIAYQDRSYGRQPRSRSAAGVLVPYLANPVHLGDWAWQTAAVFARTAKDYALSRSEGRHPAAPYVAMDVAEEIFVHHMTRYATVKAMREGYSPIYAAFYAYDETAHAFGPADPATRRVLKHVDHTIDKVARARGDSYEMVVLSDHGQVETRPFALGEALAGLLPGCRVEVAEGKTHGPPEDAAARRVLITASGGLAHVYFLDRDRRMELGEVDQLARDLSRWNEVELVMGRVDGRDVFVRRGEQLDGGSLDAVLAAHDDPRILCAQLSRLNSFASSGDLVVFGAFIDGKQANFENQAGGHGSIGGEQLHPFVLAKKEWKLDLSGVRAAHLLHPVLCDLRDRLA